MGLESQNLKELTGYIEEAFSEYMTFPTILFIVAIVVALSSIACFILAPFYIKGKARGAKTAAQVISVIDFIVGILLIFAFLIITLLLNIASDGFFDSADDFLKAVFGFLIAPARFGMPLEAVFGADASIGTPILFYALYFVTAGLLGLAAFIVSCIARGKYNAANGLIRGAAAPVGAPQYNPYQPYGQPNIPQGYPQQYGQNVQQGYPQQYGQNAPQGYPQQYQQNIPQDNEQYQSAQQEVPQNIPQDNAQYQPAQQEVPQNIPQDNAQYQPAHQEVPQDIPQDNTQYQPVSQDIPQDNTQYQPVSQEVPQADTNTEVSVQAAVAQAAPVQQASSAFCGNCGSPVTPGASFCQNCGNKIS
ncbi:MAG: zinc ribbon domain-containing protein [Ruminiclostridium sp.]|nr:zinc ribbon domain-containing protein [Ruminiclostridium sp.]